MQSGSSVVGRGACDMKAGVAAILSAVAAARASGQPLPTFAVHFVIGEEDGGLGAFATLQRGHRGRCCIIPEPTNLHVITANAGALTFRIEVPGLAAHGSARYAGASAVDSYLPIHRALAALETRRNAIVEPSMTDFPIPYPLSVGRISAGEWSSTVPDLAIVEGRFGLRIEEDPATAQREFEEAVLSASTGVPFLRDHPPVVSWPGGQFRGGQLPYGHPFADQLATLHEQVTGSPVPPPHGAPYGSDLRLYAQAGIPTLHYGPGDVRRAHTPNESVPIDQLLTTAEVFTRAVLQADQPAAG
jgi:acetylornithine deacetylase